MFPRTTKIHGMEKSKFEATFSRNKFIERLSRTNTYAAVSTYIVISALSFAFGFGRLEMTLLAKLGLLLFGLLLFSLAEYLIHRYVYHFAKIGPFRNPAYELHDFHHHHPKDKKRLAMPIPVAILVALFLLSIFWLLAGKLGLLLFSGFMLGYAGYLFLHYLIHIIGPVNPIMKYLWVHHSVHHFKDDHRAYGVSSPLWDWVFQSMPTKEQTNFK